MSTSRPRRRRDPLAASSSRKSRPQVHNLSYQLRDETHLSVGLLDDLADDIEAANSGLRRGEASAARYARKRGDGALYGAIVLNTAVIIALLVLGLR